VRGDERDLRHHRAVAVARRQRPVHPGRSVALLLNRLLCILPMISIGPRARSAFARPPSFRRGFAHPTAVS
jgi:hypothetical protein